MPPPPADHSEDTTFTQPPAKHIFTTAPHILIIGAGSRGTAYAEAALASSNSVIAAICEPIAHKRTAFGRKFIWRDTNTPQPHQQFSDWRTWVAYENQRRDREGNGEEVERGVDAVFVCVLDEMHEEVVCGIAGLELHVCCEKPLSTSLRGCINIWRALKGVGGMAWSEILSEVAASGHTKLPVRDSNRKERIFGICHVLRYSPHNMLLRQLLREKEVVGEVLSMEHVEPVGWWHFSHSYVRGNWRKESTTGPSLLTKSCHDIDFIMWLLCSPPPNAATTKPHLPTSITSTGSLKYFRKSRKPAAAGTATNCLSCPIEESCIYSAKKIYLERQLENGNTGWPVNIVNPEIEDIYKTTGKEAAAKHLLCDLGEDYPADTPPEVVEKRNWFGRCVWEADNNVCDDQCVTITWDDDPLPSSASDGSTLTHRTAKTAQFHMIAFTEKQCERRGRIYGTKGEIEYDSTTIRVHDFASGHTTVYKPHLAAGGHGGGDEGLVRQFLGAVNAVNEGMGVQEAQREWLGCDLDEAFRSHAVVFAAEEARVKKNVVKWAEWWTWNVQGRLRWPGALSADG